MNNILEFFCYVEIFELKERNYKILYNNETKNKENFENKEVIIIDNKGFKLKLKELNSNSNDIQEFYVIWERNFVDHHFLKLNINYSINYNKFIEKLIERLKNIKLKKILSYFCIISCDDLNLLKNILNNNDYNFLDKEISSQIIIYEPIQPNLKKEEMENRTLKIAKEIIPNLISCSILYFIKKNLAINQDRNFLNKFRLLNFFEKNQIFFIFPLIFLFLITGVFFGFLFSESTKTSLFSFVMIIFLFFFVIFIYLFLFVSSSKINFLQKKLYTYTNRALNSLDYVFDDENKSLLFKLKQLIIATIIIFLSIFIPYLLIKIYIIFISNFFKIFSFISNFFTILKLTNQNNFSASLLSILVSIISLFLFFYILSKRIDEANDNIREIFLALVEKPQFLNPLQLSKIRSKGLRYFLIKNKKLIYFKNFHLFREFFDKDLNSNLLIQKDLKKYTSQTLINNFISEHLSLKNLLESIKNLFRGGS